MVTRPMPSAPDRVQSIYHMCRRAEWRAAAAEGVYRGSSQDTADGFVHFSTADQLRASAAKHRAGQRDLVLLTVDARVLGQALRWEPARGGELFPHLYGPLPVAVVTRVDELPLGSDGGHLFPPGVSPAPPDDRGGGGGRR